MEREKKKRSQRPKVRSSIPKEGKNHAPNSHTQSQYNHASGLQLKAYEIMSFMPFKFRDPSTASTGQPEAISREPNYESWDLARKETNPANGARGLILRLILRLIYDFCD